MVAFQCEKWFVYQTTWFKGLLLRFFFWHIFLIKNNNSIKIKPWFQFEVFCFGENENSDLIKNFWAPVQVKCIKKILAPNWPIGICLHSVRTSSWFVPTMSTLSALGFLKFLTFSSLKYPVFSFFLLFLPKSTQSAIYSS